MRGTAETPYHRDVAEKIGPSYHRCETEGWMRQQRRFERDIKIKFHQGGRSANGRPYQDFEVKTGHGRARQAVFVLAETRNALETAQSGDRDAVIYIPLGLSPMAFLGQGPTRATPTCPHKGGRALISRSVTKSRRSTSRMVHEDPEQCRGEIKGHWLFYQLPESRGRESRAPARAPNFKG